MKTTIIIQYVTDYFVCSFSSNTRELQNSTSPWSFLYGSARGNFHLDTIMLNVKSNWSLSLILKLYPFFLSALSFSSLSLNLSKKRALSRSVRLVSLVELDR